MLHFPAASPYFYSACDAQCHGAVVSSLGTRSGKEGGGGWGAEACNGLKHHASSLSDGLCWLPSRCFTGPWRSRFVLLHRTSSEVTSQKKEKKEKRLNKLFNLVSFRFVLKNKSVAMITPRKEPVNRERLALTCFTVFQTHSCGYLLNGGESTGSGESAINHLTPESKAARRLSESLRVSDWISLSQKELSEEVSEISWHDDFTLRALVSQQVLNWTVDSRVVYLTSDTQPGPFPGKRVYSGSQSDLYFLVVPHLSVWGGFYDCLMSV